MLLKWVIKYITMEIMLHLGDLYKTKTNKRYATLAQNIWLQCFLKHPIDLFQMFSTINLCIFKDF